MGKRFARKHVILFTILPSIFALDQIVKTQVERVIPLYASIPVIPGLFSIVHIRNTGAAFGFLGGGIAFGRTLFFVALTVGALVLISFLFTKVKEDRILLPACFAMIMGGALGNLVDRIRWGYVVDYLDLYWGIHHWPAFNVADSAITLGVVLLFVQGLFPKNEHREGKAGVKGER